MTRIGWCLVDVVSRVLEPDEREAVRGDLAEAGETGGQALRDVFGLVFRRQAALWKDCRPWLALVGLVIPVGMLLSVISMLTADGNAINIWLYANNWDWALLESPGFQHGFLRFIVGVSISFLTLMCWSWTIGFVLGALSRGAIPVNGALFCVMLVFGELVGAPRVFGLFMHRARDFDNNAAVFALTFYRVVFPLIVQTVLVMLPALWGMRQGFRLATLQPLLRAILWTAVCATVAAIAIQSWIWWRFPNAYTRPAIWGGWQIQLLHLVVYWPVGYLVASATGRRWGGKTAAT
jgi:hypothetical protein